MNTAERNSFESIPEAALQDKIYNFLFTWFDIDFEVTSDCRTKRIDFLFFHKSDTQKLYPMGIELKRTSVKKGSEISKWCLQAQEYTKLKFNGHKPTIFICPQISGWYLDEGERVSKHNVEAWGYLGAHNNVNLFLYQSFGFGEFQKYYNGEKQGLRLVANTYIIWDTRDPLYLNVAKLSKCR